MKLTALLDSWIERPGSGRRLMQATLVAVVAFLIMAALRVAPTNHLSPEIGRYAGPVNRSVENVHLIALERAEKPFWEVTDHLIFFGRNPGLFQFVAEIAVRLGMRDSPLPLQIIMIAFNAIGLALMALWVAVLFKDERVAIVALIFMTGTPMLLHQATSIHSPPYNFLFFNATIVFFILWIRGGRQRQSLLFLTSISYFLCCMNYWFFWLSLGAFLVSIAWFEGQLVGRKAWAILFFAPAAALLVTLSNVVYDQGGLGSGFYRLTEIFVARTVDSRLPGSTWFPEKRFLAAADILRYPLIVNHKLKVYFLFGWIEFGILMFFARKVFANARLYRFLLFSALASTTWYFFMFQHVKIHSGVGVYAWFGAMLVFSVVSVESLKSRSSPQTRIAANVLLFVLGAAAAFGLGRHYFYPMIKMIENLAA